jgi:hypothetical protein
VVRQTELIEGASGEIGLGVCSVSLSRVNLTGQTYLVVIIGIPKIAAQFLDLGTESAGGYLGELCRAQPYVLKRVSLRLTLDLGS